MFYLGKTTIFKVGRVAKTRDVSPRRSEKNTLIFRRFLAENRTQMLENYWLHEKSPKKRYRDSLWRHKSDFGSILGLLGGAKIDEKRGPACIAKADEKDMQRKTAPRRKRCIWWRGPAECAGRWGGPQEGYKNRSGPKSWQELWARDESWARA